MPWTRTSKDKSFKQACVIYLTQLLSDSLKIDVSWTLVIFFGIFFWISIFCVLIWNQQRVLFTSFTVNFQKNVILIVAVDPPRWPKLRNKVSLSDKIKFAHISCLNNVPLMSLLKEPNLAKKQMQPTKQHIFRGIDYFLI